jgi:tetratricopeptide (TPR) repeat protein
MIDNKYVLGLCMMGLFCSMVFSENDILWDFGVVIIPPDIQNYQKDALHQHPANQKVFQSKINAVITDPFVPPVKSTLSSQISDSSVIILPEKIMKLTSEKNISQISKEAKKYYFKKNYRYVIELLYQRDLELLSEQNRNDLDYLLADAFYHTGEYKKALGQVLSLLKQNKSDRLYLLLSMIYESLGENNTAKEHYLKLIDQFPNSDYITSAKIKARILGQH